MDVRSLTWVRTVVAFCGFGLMLYVLSYGPVYVANVRRGVPSHETVTAIYWPLNSIRSKSVAAESLLDGYFHLCMRLDLFESRH